MAYCVNCGVELEASLEKCPLCNTPVYHPVKEEKSKPASPYPGIRKADGPCNTHYRNINLYGSGLRPSELIYISDECLVFVYYRTVCGILDLLYTRHDIPKTSLFPHAPL